MIQIKQNMIHGLEWIGDSSLLLLLLSPLSLQLLLQLECSHVSIAQ